MCGIAGMLDSGAGVTIEHQHRIANNMATAMRHRGPDAAGCWQEGSVSLAHSRLSVLDLSALANQPMLSKDGRIVVVYNGEIYNADQLRGELKRQGIVFNSSSDTEVLVESIRYWGIDKATEKFIGMFAFSVWDRQTQTLSLVRDRFGIKPLYWGNFDKLFLFGSELKALREHPGWQPRVNRDVLAAYMRFNYIPAPSTIYQHVHKLMPGSILSINAGKKPHIRQYWKMEDVVHNGLQERIHYTNDQEIIAQTEAMISEAVKRRMVADVPLGALLSGGIDSSTVVMLMQKHNMQKVKTFSIGFDEQAYNEAIYAHSVAKRLGTEHTELYVSANDALKVIPSLPSIYDEPFADESQIPTYILSKLARKYVTVALSGDGGDEVFGGYNRYFFARNHLPKLKYIPLSMRKRLAQIINACPPNVWYRLLQLFPEKLRLVKSTQGIYKLAKIMAATEIEVHKCLISHWENPEKLVIGSKEPDYLSSHSKVLSFIDDQAEKMQYLDTMSYLPNDILTKVDRASMAVSLEIRVPLLDHQLVQHGWSLPLSAKLRGNKSKWVLRQILYQHLPTELVDRQKQGFAIPLNDWLRGTLRDWAESLLDENKLRTQGFFDPMMVRRCWQKHLSGRHESHDRLWSILMFQAWHELWLA